MERMITYCVLIFHLGFVASSPFAYPEGYIANEEPQSQYQHYQKFAQPLYGQQLQYDNAARASAQAFVGNAYNNGYPDTQKLTTTMPNTAFVNAKQRQSFQNVLAPASTPAQQVQEQIAAETKNQRAKQAIKELANDIKAQTVPVSQPISFVAQPYVNNLPSVNGPAPQWTQAVATAEVQQQRTGPSTEIVTPFSQIYNHVVQRPHQNYDSQFLQRWKQQLQTPEPSHKKKYLLIYPDGRTEYVDKIDTVKERYPNYVLVNAGQSPTTIAQKTKPSGLEQQSVLTVPLQQQGQTGRPQPQTSQQPNPYFPRQPSQTTQQTQPNNSQSDSQPQPTMPQPNSQSESNGQTGQQSQPKSSPPSNAAIQNPLESLILNSMSAQPVQQPAPAPEQKTTSVIAPANVNLPQSAEKTTNIAQSEDQPLNVSANPSAPQHSSSDSQPDSPANQPQVSSSDPVNEPSYSVYQTQPQTDESNKESQTQSSQTEDQSQSASPEEQSSNSEDQLQPQISNPNDQPEPQPSQDDNQQSEPTEHPNDSESESESDSIDHQPQPESTNPKDQDQPNSTDSEAQPLKSSNQSKPSNPSDETQPLTANSDDNQQSQPADALESQPTNPTQDDESQSSENEPQLLKNEDESNSQDSDTPNTTSESTALDNSPDDEQVALKQEAPQSPGKIVILDNTGLQSKDMTLVDSEILKNLFGDSPYAVVQFFLVHPQRILERNVTRMYFGDHHILEEVTESDQYGDAQPIVTSETHLLNVPQPQES